MIRFNYTESLLLPSPVCLCTVYCQVQTMLTAH